MPAVPPRPGEPPSQSRMPPVPPRTAWEERPVSPPPPHPAEVSDRWFVSDAFPRDPAARLEEEWTATWEQNSRARPGRHSEPPATGGRRRREDPVPELLPDPEPEPPRPPDPARRHARPDNGAASTGGRRRAPEPNSDWQELADWDPVVRATRNNRNGSHSNDEPARRPAQQPSGTHSREQTGRRPAQQPSGSHSTGGHSVADLLAAHGSTEPRRRRRRED
jgi:hypothetical protein